MNTLHSPRKEHSKTEFGKKNSEENFGESETFSISAAKLNENRMMYNVSDATNAQIKGYYLTQIQGQTLDILWVFSSVEIFHHRIFWILSTAEIQPYDGFITQWVFISYTTTFKDLVYGQSSSHWQRLRVSSYRGCFLFNHEPYQPHWINKVGVSFQTNPLGTITYTHSQ